jgi:hypothetical protein
MVFSQKSKPIIFAVINDGKTIEPIAHIENNKLVKTVTGDMAQTDKKTFNELYYNDKSKYKLIFSGLNSGVVTVKSSDYNADCSSNMAAVEVESKSAKLNGFVMGLATDLRTNKTASGVRRRPDSQERSVFNRMLRAELSKQKVTKQQLKSLKYHNFTAIDVDNSGNVELVGTYWVDLSATERGLMFLIVDFKKGGKSSVTLSKYSTIKQKDVMNEEINTIDEGIYHELLLDYFDYDNDGVGEIFTMVQGFEGSNFNVYKRQKNQWVLAHEFSNYHCGF